MTRIPKILIKQDAQRRAEAVGGSFRVHAEHATVFNVNGDIIGYVMATGPTSCGWYDYDNYSRSVFGV